MSSSVTLQPQTPLTFCFEELPLLYAQILLPCRSGPRSHFFNSYYQLCSRRFTRRCGTEWFPAARDAYLQAVENAGAIPQWQARLRSTVTLLRPELISLRLDVSLTGAQRQQWVQGDVWDLRQGLPLTLRDCFPRGAPWRRMLADCAAGQIGRWEQQGVACYREKQPQQLASAFRPRHFYLTEEGLSFFFPQDTIAPAVEGVPTFCLPYNDECGPWIPQT